ncbi:uncharacterized protein LOC126382053 [Pectinophora gossypiella]|uniref:uncharacterized protein LOC126382053 n=1 Tax=Pectinophora gossypiella TaxID=13191 RepID=UPI00214F5CBB|nr:uncharacterized protein LOC126382053 [Pectinophora gossypiella]XP_049887697.1 uncharacterized protein LOC126382053 [Pectinophora gossypiella]
MEAFIEGVRAQPCLWNPLHQDYRETHVKDDAWQRVVDHYNDSSIPNIHVAKTEWKKLRDNHRDALKRAKLGKNKLLPAQITTWKYAKVMQFLEPHMKYRITENIEMDPPTTGSTSKNSDQDVSTTEAPETIESPSKRRCTGLDRSNEVKAKSDPDALESFFNCILQSTREMPQWMQTQVKKKIFAVIIESEEYLAQDQNPKHYEPHIAIETKIKTEVFTEDSCDRSYS